MQPGRFWSDQRVFVTGGSGFLGSFVVEKLQGCGAQEIFIPCKREYDLVEMGDGKRMLQDARPEIIIHLAANVGGIDVNREKPAGFFYDILMMGVQLMHEAWKQGVKKFVAIGTVCAYPKFTPAPFSEDDLWNGYPEETNAPYGLAKKMLLVQAQAYRQRYGCNAVYLLPVNLYDPRDNFDPGSLHVIPAIVREVIEAQQHGNKAVTLWGGGSATREFLYVEDAADGILRDVELYNGTEPVNLGSGYEISIRSLAETICRLVGFKGTFIWDAREPNGQPRRALDTRRAEEYFQFRAHTSFEDGLRRTIHWYRQLADRSQLAH